MSDKFKNSKFYKAMKNPKVSRALYVSLSLMLIALAVVIGIVASANRSKKNNVPNPPLSNDSQVTTNGGVQEKPNDTGVKVDDTTTSGVGENDKPSSPVVSTPPVFSLPVSGKLTKSHDAKLQVFSETMNDYRVHLGIDIATAESSPVYAAADGKVSRIWKDAMMGYCIAIEHSGDSVSVYKNLSNTLPDGITEGATVKAGQQIATVGESAMVEVADEPHLHFEISVGGILQDPTEYFSAKDLEALKSDTAYEN